ncbi:hypothetical protein PSD9_103 [Shigella phage PSD9]|nr:hypothetical protein PSD9_103 [Shigella phage PSD9]
MAYNQETIYQVYRLVDQDKKPFYFGKGVSARPEQHFEEAKKFNKADPQGNAEKLAKIQELLESGLKPSDMIEIIKSNLNEHEAFSLEGIYIDEYWDSITNRVRGLSEEKRCFVKFDLSEPDTKIHYDRYIHSMDGKFTQTAETSNVMTFEAAKTLIEMSDIMVAYSMGWSQRICVIESLEIVSLLSLIGYDTSDILFISTDSDKARYVFDTFGCFSGFEFIKAPKKMKFNTVIMNPPFTSDVKFLDKALECADNVISITPASFLYSMGVISHRPEAKKRLNYAIIDCNGGNKYFSASPTTALAISKFSKNETQGFTLINGRTKAKYNYNNDDFVSIILNNKSAKSIADKTRTKEKLNNYEGVEKEYYVNFIRKLGPSSTTSDNSEIIMGKLFYSAMTNTKTRITKEKPPLQAWASFDTFEEAENAIEFYSYAPIKVACQYFLGLGGGTGGKKMVQNAPVVDFTKKWTREMIQERFNITDLEWQYAENVVNGVSLDEISN